MLRLFFGLQEVSLFTTGEGVFLAAKIVYFHTMFLFLHVFWGS